MKLDKNNIYHGDCLDLMEYIKSGSIDLILTDPPYGTIKNISNVDTIQHGLCGKTRWDDKLNLKKMFFESERILRENGALILFSQEPYTSELIRNCHSNTPFSYRMIWLKDHFANSLIAKKAPVSYFEDICVFFKKYDTLNNNPLRDYSKNIMDCLSLTSGEINKILKHGKAEHFFRVNSTQYKLCTKDVYQELIYTFKIDKLDFFMKYEVLKGINDKYKDKYKRCFNLEYGKKYKSNILEYKKDYSGLHPTQKPLELMKDLVSTYSNQDDLVLDFTCGSGSTLVACKELNRNYIGIEKDKKYYDIAKDRLSKYIVKGKNGI